MKTIAQKLNIKKFPFIIKDKSGDMIYFEDIRGFWYKKELDSTGRQTYLENSNGFWAKRKYDESGNLIYYENSDGKIIDNKPNICVDEVIEIKGKKYKLIEI